MPTSINLYFPFLLPTTHFLQDSLFAPNKLLSSGKLLNNSLPAPTSQILRTSFDETNLVIVRGDDFKSSNVLCLTGILLVAWDFFFPPWGMFLPFWLFMVLWEQWLHSLQLIIIMACFYNLKRHLLIDMGVKINYNASVSRCIPRLILWNKINRIENMWSVWLFK